jgi:hypothetical protein
VIAVLTDIFQKKYFDLNIFRPLFFKYFLTVITKILNFFIFVNFNVVFENQLRQKVKVSKAGVDEHHNS